MLSLPTQDKPVYSDSNGMFVGHQRAQQMQRDRTYGASAAADEPIKHHLASQAMEYLYALNDEIHRELVRRQENSKKSAPVPETRARRGGGKPEETEESAAQLATWTKFCDKVRQDRALDAMTRYNPFTGLMARYTASGRWVDDESQEPAPGWDRAPQLQDETARGRKVGGERFVEDRVQANRLPPVGYFPSTPRK